MSPDPCPPSSTRRHLLAAAGLAVALPLPARAFWRDDTLRIELDAARALHEAGRARLLDVREADEHAQGVARGALLMPTSQIGRRLAELPRDAARPLLVICATQVRSGRIAQALHERGFSGVRYVQGGMSGWVARGWPVVAPTRT